MFSKFFKENTSVLLIAAAAVLLHFIVNIFTAYGIFRDELYYIACSKRLAFGYVDQPPLCALILSINNLIFGDSLFAIRILPAISHALTIVYSALIAKELSGSKKAQIITSLSVLIAGVYLSIFNFYSMNFLDILFWTICIYIVIRIINTGNHKLWLYFGLFAGLAFENKLSIVFLAAALMAGILLTSNRKWLLNKYFWGGAAIAVVLSIPNVIWQVLNNYPTLEFMRNATEQKNAVISPIVFTIEQIMQLNPVTALVWLPGLYYLLFSKRLKSHRLFGIAYLFLIIFFIVQHGKPYYLCPIYPVLFAAGGTFWEAISLKKNYIIPALAAVLIIMGIIGSPMAVPLLPQETYIGYAAAFGIKPGSQERDNPGPLGQHYADMHGWKELSDKVMRVYNSLSPSEKEQCIIFAQNYGQAGAIEYFGQRNGLPLVISSHNNYWIWGPGTKRGDILIIIGGDEEDYKKGFNTYYIADKFYHKYSRSFENHLPIYVCKGIKVDLKKIWPELKEFI